MSTGCVPTPPHYLNERIDLATEARVRQYAGQPASVIWRRIEALDREWDVERVPEANAATLGLAARSPRSKRTGRGCCC